MLVLGSYGFSSPETRQKLDKIITDKTGKMLIIPLATMFGKETREKKRNTLFHRWALTKCRS